MMTMEKVAFCNCKCCNLRDSSAQAKINTWTHLLVVRTSFFFFCGTQNEMFIRMARLLFSIQQTLTLNKCKEREKLIQKIKNVHYHSKVFQLGMTFFVVERN